MIVHTTIGFGSPNKAGKSSAHGSPLGKDELLLTKKALGWKETSEFAIPAEALKGFRQAAERGRAAQREWRERFEAWSREVPDLAQQWKRAWSNALPAGWDAGAPTFDPAKKYPVLIPVYGGPASAGNTARESFVTPSAIAEYGFLVVNLDSRAAPGMGKRTLDSIYLKLGQVEIDDMAEGVKALWSRPYVDKARVGMYGTSYGGYSSVMSLLRHPDVYAAASASSPVTAWEHYDTIYTERYMWIPQENKAGYQAGSAMTYAGNLKGRLMLYYGTADNNVHPSNMMQLIDALQRAGKSFDVQVGPDRGHSGINTDRMMEFFIENLIVRPAALQTTSQ